jgi:hypothetical protein
MKLTQDDRNKIEVQLVEMIIDGHQHHHFPYTQMKKSARYILQHIDHLQNEEDLTHFLHNLSTHWPLFESIYKKLQSKSEAN